MSNEDLKRIVEEVVGNNDPYWNNPVFNIVKKIVDMPNNTETTIIQLADFENKSDSKFMLEIDGLVRSVCKKIGIVLDADKYKDTYVGLSQNIPFIKKESDIVKPTSEIIEKCICGNDLKLTWDRNEEFKEVRCPNCNSEMRFKNPMYVKDAYIPLKAVNNEQSLDDLIKKLSGIDPFWETSLKKYFDSLNKTIDEKINFLKKLSYTSNLFNEFTKEIIRPNNPEELYNKYNV